MSLPIERRVLPPQGAGHAAEPKTYRVCYAVTRAEWYDIAADNADDAEERAYVEGSQIDRHGKPTECGEAGDVVFCERFEVKEGGGR